MLNKLSLSNSGVIRTNACSVLVVCRLKLYQRWAEMVRFVPTLVSMCIYPLSALGSKLSQIQLKPLGQLGLAFVFQLKRNHLALLFT